MKLFLTVILLVLINGCTENSLNIGYDRTPNSILAEEIKKKVFWKLKKEEKLYLCECGWSFEGKKQIQMFHCGFDYYNEIGIEEARELMISIGNQLLTEINSHEELRSYLGPFPFKPKNLLIHIFLQKPDGSALEPEKLHVISLDRGFVEYEIEALETRRLTTIYTETYEAAAEKLNLPLAL